MATLQVRHNIEVAHRLSLLPGKCEAIHGHSMWVTLELAGRTGRIYETTGLMEGLDFGAVKKAFRGYLDSEFDHRLLLNESDPVAKQAQSGVDLPGLRTCPGDPTTENIARWIAKWSKAQWPGYVKVQVNETHVNAATYEL
jgi:6-pyruvoyltetrahydropterin/6-carboxytetrahydropterin synthase